MEILRNRVLDTIMRHGPISARQIMNFVDAEEKQVRSSIDVLRAHQVPIWFDVKRRAFWWSDDARPSGALYRQWKRPYKA